MEQINQFFPPSLRVCINGHNWNANFQGSPDISRNKLPRSKSIIYICHTPSTSSSTQPSHPIIYLSTFNFEASWSHFRRRFYPYNSKIFVKNNEQKKMWANSINNLNIYTKKKLRSNEIRNAWENRQTSKHYFTKHSHIKINLNPERKNKRLVNALSDELVFFLLKYFLPSSRAPSGITKYCS